MENISITPNVVFTIADTIPVTSSHLAVFVVVLGILIWGVYTGIKAKIVPSAGQMAMEGIIGWFDEKITPAFKNPKVATRVAPLIISFFLIILFSNIFGLFPIISQIVVNGNFAAFRTPTSHLSMTLALTIIALAVTHISALSVHPLKYIGNYIKIAPFLKVRSLGDFAKALLDLFLGFLDIVGELAKVVSLSCRLFGNVFSGELMAIVIMGLSAYTQFIVPLPFIVLSLFSGIIQAAVFSLLSLNYISLALASVRED